MRNAYERVIQFHCGDDEARASFDEVSVFQFQCWRRSRVFLPGEKHCCHSSSRWRRTQHRVCVLRSASLVFVLHPLSLPALSRLPLVPSRQVVSLQRSVELSHRPSFNPTGAAASRCSRTPEPSWLAGWLATVRGFISVAVD